MSAIIVENEILHYEVLGRGRPLLFIHGWVGSWRYWIPTMQATSIAFRSYALDLWGFGDSAKSPKRYSIDDQIKLLDDFFQEMGIGKIALVGHGLGAIVGLKYAEKYPKYVDRVMAISLPLEPESLNPRIGTSNPVELSSWLLANTPGKEPAILEAPKADSQAIIKSLDGVSSHRVLESLGSLQTPILLVYGQNDPAVQPPNPDNLASLPEHNHLIFFDDAGHFPMLDQQSKFNRLLADFLALPSGESPRQLQLKEEWKRRVR